jgi:hypothetical protein
VGVAVKQTDKKPRPGDGTPGPGRKKGVPNKVTGQLKEMILKALDDAGGAAYLLEQAKGNPNAFLTLVGKVLPMTIAGDPDGAPVQVTWQK